MENIKKERRRKDALQKKIDILGRALGVYVVLIMVDGAAMFVTSFLLVLKWWDWAGPVLAYQFFALAFLALALWRTPVQIKKLKKQIRNGK